MECVVVHAAELFGHDARFSRTEPCRFPTPTSPAPGWYDGRVALSVPKALRLQVVAARAGRSPSTTRSAAPARGLGRQSFAATARPRRRPGGGGGGDTHRRSGLTLPSPAAADRRAMAARTVPPPAGTGSVVNRCGGGSATLGGPPRRRPSRTMAREIVVRHASRLATVAVSNRRREPVNQAQKLTSWSAPGPAARTALARRAGHKQVLNYERLSVMAAPVPGLHS